ncbi:hypothetical protein V1499_11160 [Neobacillus sp. SCS-31]|uniref:hypothetical protein n=1 Tax=Neobacillus oceani TaxID=3115292 RepID=UPI003905D167
MANTCKKCKTEINKSDAIKTDEFGVYGSDIYTYCPSCFIDEVKHGFDNYEIGN